MAKLYYFYGPMASSKSLRLLTTAYDLENKGIDIMVLKPSVDNRDGDGIIRSRAGIERKCVTFGDDVNLYKAIKAYRNALAAELKNLVWVIVDECQFMTERQVTQLSDVVDFLDVNVICYGLRTDFQGKLFPGSKRLFELADDIEEIKATCGVCGKRKECINARFDSNGEIIIDGVQVDIGGDEKYKPICRKCWKEMVKEKEEKINSEI